MGLLVHIKGAGRGLAAITRCGSARVPGSNTIAQDVTNNVRVVHTEPSDGRLLGVTKTLLDVACVLCGAGRSGKGGEHVLPRWLLDMWPPQSGPFVFFRNGVPVLGRNGRVRTQTSAARFKLPVCPRCNNVLDQRFEKPAKSLVQRLFDVGSDLDPSEVAVVGIWFVKTWLLLGHPKVQVSEPAWKSTSWEPIRPALYTWMTSGSEVPQGLSAWLMRVDREAPPASMPREIPLPRVVADGRTIQFQAFEFGLGSIDVTLVYHPMWEIDHPFVADRRAAQLWPPQSGRGLNVEGLALMRPGNMTWPKRTTIHFAPDTFGRVDLRPLSDSTDFTHDRDLSPAIQKIFWSTKER